MRFDDDRPLGRRPHSFWLKATCSVLATLLFFMPGTEGVGRGGDFTDVDQFEAAAGGRLLRLDRGDGDVAEEPICQLLVRLEMRPVLSDRVHAVYPPVYPLESIKVKGRRRRHETR